MRRSRTGVIPVSLALGLTSVMPWAVTGWTQQEQSTGPTVIASCDFEGPYSVGEQQTQDGCINNWQWGRKDMLLKADKDAGRPGTAQRRSRSEPASNKVASKVKSGG